MKTRQPAQKMFETRLATALLALDPQKSTFIEAESSKIGERIIPPALWTAMNTAKRVEISATLEARSAFLSRAYADLTQDRTQLAELINRLRPYHASVVITEWQDHARSGAWERLAAGLITHHYDPRYSKSAASTEDAAHQVTLDDLEDATLVRAAATLAAQFI